MDLAFEKIYFTQSNLRTNNTDKFMPADGKNSTIAALSELKTFNVSRNYHLSL